MTQPPLLTHNNKINILAISGSTRAQSSNLDLIKAIADLTADRFSITIFEGLSVLPHFNPDLDLDTENAPPAVVNFRQQLQAADGVLICTPEYAVGVPGTLKNALDWTVSSMDFSQKPVALITAATSGITAHKALLGTLLIIESKITDEMQLVVSSVKTKVSKAGKITDPDTLFQVNKLIHAFTDVITGNGVPVYLPAPSAR
ncbi:NADPH-dependent FMN reductase [Chitinophaga defluvii]|uniref:NADPH-dependent FMN reductase n=1 Tax=Chitinophaga defluvii TaxID=3163343 RepID=A0ABV2T4W8_9BACT